MSAHEELRKNVSEGIEALSGVPLDTVADTLNEKTPPEPSEALLKKASGALLDLMAYTATDDGVTQPTETHDLLLLVDHRTERGHALLKKAMEGSNDETAQLALAGALAGLSIGAKIRQGIGAMDYSLRSAENYVRLALQELKRYSGERDETIQEVGQAQKIINGVIESAKSYRDQSLEP
jgi:hypothetical protein